RMTNECFTWGPYLVFDLRSLAVLQHGLLAAYIGQHQLAAFLIKFLKAVEAISRIPEHLASLADVAKLLGKLEQSNLSPNNLLFGRHGVLQSAEAGRGAIPTAPRPASAYNS